ncbi:solute carrier family 13, member 2/3/5 [Methylomarinovum tepidoasis]|uniref:Solute carrier family 13, member 2/3/5 n=1 Tax=Methylomarinovum tepidoasis TaxID=2840183 RepID=A0AAU9CD50_9GAMM|nr:DASS family sodium-coupled anion symporter [Methylomarinovum sp. IN45]BCX88133.1 solute carrier family 13, member 2/3/5 [Methylomarinovum sp. IN45]
MKPYRLLLSAAVFAALWWGVELGRPETGAMAAVAGLMACLWLTEAIPLAVTALLPLVLFPLLGIAATKAVAAKYMNATVFLLLGGFLIAQALERWQLHRRIALGVLGVFGGRPVAVLAGFVCATAFLSMWISNTASTLVMLPIASAVLSRFEALLPAEQARCFAVALLLALAYAASLGGVMSLVGSPPNLVFARLYQEATGVEVDFLRWTLVGLPVGATLLAVLVGYLALVYLRRLESGVDLAGVVAAERAALGPMGREEKAVAGVFAATALLWLTRKGVTLGNLRLPGWQSWLPHGGMVDDGTVAIAMAVLLFLLPARREDGGRTTLLDATVFSRLPWGVVILFGGGFALASGFVDSGLSAWLAARLGNFAGIGRLGAVTLMAAGMTFLTELTSNTATTQLVLPLLASLARVLHLEPVWLMLPAALSASCAFMFPVATPPNAIVFASGRLAIGDMVKTGLLLNLVGIAVVVAVTSGLIPLLFEEVGG